MRPSPARPYSRLRWPAALGGVLTALALWSSQALAAPAADPESQTIPEGSSAPTSVGDGGGGTLLRLGIGLVLVVGLILLVWFVLKRFQRSRYPAAAESRTGLIDVVATTALGPNRALHLVRVGGQIILVGSTDQAVTRLAEIAPEDAAALVDLAPPDGRFGTTPPAAGGPGVDDRARAVATSTDASVIERLRNLTTRK
jgi:flagellar protein FliO/FliZ